jgi:hypothetical protein
VTASTVPLAVGYLFDNIKAAVNDPAVLVSYGPPTPNHPNDMIVIEGVSREAVPFQMVGSGGAGWIDETYTIEVNCWVYRGGGPSGQVPFERASALADIVDSVVRSDPSLGGAVVVASPERRDYTQSWDDDHAGRLVEALVGVRCRARI